MHKIVHVEYACELMYFIVEFQDEIFLRGEECKTRENPYFFRKVKIVISIENPEFFLDLG